MQFHFFTAVSFLCFNLYWYGAIEARDAGNGNNAPDYESYLVSISFIRMLQTDRFNFCLVGYTYLCLNIDILYFNFQTKTHGFKITKGFYRQN